MNLIKEATGGHRARRNENIKTIGAARCIFSGERLSASAAGWKHKFKRFGVRFGVSPK